jgi:hypothetical protein
VPIRDFISLSSPLVAVSLLFFWCTAVKKEIPEKCGAAVANILRLNSVAHDLDFEIQPADRVDLQNAYLPVSAFPTLIALPKECKRKN